MKTLWFVSLVAITAALTVGGVLFLVAQAEPPLGGSLVFAIAALTVFVCGPVCVAAVAIYWDVRNTDARRYFRVYLRVVLVLEFLASVAIVTYAALEGSSIWLPVAFIGIGGALTGLVVFASPRIAAKYRKPEVQVVWAPITRAEIVRGVRTIAIWFLGTLVVVLVGFAFVQPDAPLERTLVALQLAFTAGAVASVFVSVPFARRLGAITGSDISRTSNIARVVIQGKAMDLNEAEQDAAAKYAATWQTVQAFQLGFLALFYVGIAFSQLDTFVAGSTTGLAVPVLSLLAATAVIIGPLAVLQIRRARRYAREHAHRLPVAA
ncbi:hypothetical protein [Conyzicola sp.]|uniref:hypothetical protein n=1 Tax=Conyzicola sp. TaxID=1969404 RepID=UPI003989D9A9